MLLSHSHDSSASRTSSVATAEDLDDALSEFLHEEDEQGNAVSDEQDIESALELAQFDRFLIAVAISMPLMGMESCFVEYFVHPVIHQPCLHNSHHSATPR